MGTIQTHSISTEVENSVSALGMKKLVFGRKIVIFLLFFDIPLSIIFNYLTNLCGLELYGLISVIMELQCLSAGHL